MKSTQKKSFFWKFWNFCSLFFFKLLKFAIVFLLSMCLHSEMSEKKMRDLFSGMEKSSVFPEVIDVL